MTPDPCGNLRMHARARAYTLFGELVHRGVRPDHLELLGAVGELAPSVRLPFDAEAEAAAHYALFGHEVFPFESAFRSDDGRVGGPHAAAVAASYAAEGFAPDATSDAPDHLGHELAFLGRLSYLECCAASRAPDGVQVGRLRGAQRAFLDDHLLTWFPALAIAVRMRADRFWVAVVELLLNLTIAHRAELGEAGALDGVGDAASPGLPDLDDPETSLRDVARALLVPARSGLFVARADLQAVGRGLGVPRGFGERADMLATLLFSAAELGRLPDLIASLDAHAVEWETVLAEYGALWPPVVPLLAAWEERLAATRALLSGLARGAATEAPSTAGR